MPDKTSTYRLAGMHCDACEKTITKALSRVGVNVVSINHQTQEASLQYDPEIHSFASIVKIVGDLGYELQIDGSRADDEIPAEGFFKRVQRVLKMFRNDPNSFSLEKSIVRSSAGTFLVISALMYLTYAILFWNIENFWNLYGQYMIYLILAVVISGAAIRQQRAYRSGVSCMSGMMIGMTIGMVSSMLVGIVMGATNGMFTGAVFSMLIGMGLGAWVGACCGIMGVMEGMMAGLMGGTMGPMISVMMISDHINTFLPIFFIACLGIILGLMYMVQKEQKNKRAVVKPYPFWSFTFLNFFVVLLGSLLMVWGPRASFLIG